MGSERRPAEDHNDAQTTDSDGAPGRRRLPGVRRAVREARTTPPGARSALQLRHRGTTALGSLALRLSRIRPPHRPADLRRSADPERALGEGRKIGGRRIEDRPMLSSIFLPLIFLPSFLLLEGAAQIISAAHGARLCKRSKRTRRPFAELRSRRSRCPLTPLADPRSVRGSDHYSWVTSSSSEPGPLPSPFPDRRT